MIKRRDFLKRTVKNTIAYSSLGGLPAFSSAQNLINQRETDSTINTFSDQSNWIVSFDDEKKTFYLKNGAIIISANATFKSKDINWEVVKSRDGVLDRYAIVDIENNVQGYLVFNPSIDALEVLFYHRTAQNYLGELTLDGEIKFSQDGFTCKTIPNKNERVLLLNKGSADSLLNDSIFSPLQDLLLQMKSSDLLIQTIQKGKFSFRMSGEITEASESSFVFQLRADYFKKRYVPYYRSLAKKNTLKAPTGWMSWNTYFDTATAEDNLKEARLGKKYFLPLGCEIWSIESWQGNSDKLPVSGFYNMDLEINKKQFPKGMKELADEIRKLGFRPGIWMAPFGTGNTDFYKTHKDWFLHDKEGKPIASWNGKYTLDPTVKAARDHLKEIHRIASKEWGYEFFKIDGMSGRNHGYCAHLYERPEIKACFSDPACKNPFELCIQAFREGIGEDRIFLACQGHSSGPEAYYADASRIGADIVHANQPVLWDGVMNQGRCLLNQVFTHNIVMISDPDTLLVHDLPIEEARTSATIVALPGQLTFFGDKLSLLKEEKISILQKTLPVADIYPGNLYPFFHMLPIWNLSIYNKLLGNYNVIAFFNWEEESQIISATTKELGLYNQEYLGFEFWTEETIKHDTKDNKITLTVPPHGVRLVALHEIKKHPQWISSNRHIVQDASELTSYYWIEDKQALKGRIKLIANFSIKTYVNIPEEYRFLRVDCKGVASKAELNGKILSILLLSKKTLEVDFCIYFDS